MIRRICLVVTLIMVLLFVDMRFRVDIMINTHTGIDSKTNNVVMVNKKQEGASPFKRYKKYTLSKKKRRKLKYYSVFASKIVDGDLKIMDTSSLDFSKSVNDFKKKYKKYKKKYEKIAKDVSDRVFSKKERRTYGIPPELIAALHFRENEEDFKGGQFYYSPEDGKRELGSKIKEGRIVEFISVEENMFTKKKEQIKNIRLRSKSKDIVAMCVFALLHNGVFGDNVNNTNSNNNWECSCYVFNGTSGYASGKFTEDGQYDKGFIDRQVGVLRTLDAILNV